MGWIFVYVLQSFKPIKWLFDRNCDGYILITANKCVAELHSENVINPNKSANYMKFNEKQTKRSQTVGQDHLIGMPHNVDESQSNIHLKYLTEIPYLD